jgi:uncharacterized damage-inducible protein DinB
MTKEFDSDLRELRGELSTSRAELVSVIESLADSDLDRARRGGWTISRVLEHVIQSESMYTAAIAAIAGGSASSPQGAGPPASQEEAVRQLLCTREALATALTRRLRKTSTSFSASVTTNIASRACLRMWPTMIASTRSRFGERSLLNQPATIDRRGSACRSVRRSPNRNRRRYDDNPRGARPRV